jgi:hypothetical protein
MRTLVLTRRGAGGRGGAGVAAMSRHQILCLCILRRVQTRVYARLPPEKHACTPTVMHAYRMHAYRQRNIHNSTACEARGQTETEGVRHESSKVDTYLRMRDLSMGFLRRL